MIMHSPTRKAFNDALPINEFKNIGVSIIASMVYASSSYEDFVDDVNDLYVDVFQSK